ncbi:hypothetical protein RJT34_08513 [Clitoria ternatea]|uniref:Uncharacterized protein n=1 Tax=Clitoria ternatea TaxID=43366 RepID=A0AAN9K6B1_CLITE
MGFCFRISSSLLLPFQTLIFLAFSSVLCDTKIIGIMKFSAFFVFLLLLLAALITFFNFFNPTTSAASSFPDLVATTNCGDRTTLIATSRKLKENDISIRSSISTKDDNGEVTLNDYNPIDPVPSSSKASVNAGPIEHGSPLNPYIVPKPSPPPRP